MTSRALREHGYGMREHGYGMREHGYGRTAVARVFFGMRILL
jgi:hypothetical protein